MNNEVGLQPLHRRRPKFYLCCDGNKTYIASTTMMSALAAQVPSFVMRQNKGKENGAVFKLCNKISMLAPKGALYIMVCYSSTATVYPAAPTLFF